MKVKPGGSRSHLTGPRIVAVSAECGLAFRHAGWICPPGGFEPSQAAALIEAVVQVDHAEGVVIADCEIGHTGPYGIWFRDGCLGCRVGKSLLHDIVSYDYGGGQGRGRFESDHNLYWTADPGGVNTFGRPMAKWREAGHDLNSVVENPGFVDPAKDDFRFKDPAVAAWIGFTPFDVAAAGVRRGKRRRRRCGWGGGNEKLKQRRSCSRILP